MMQKLTTVLLSVLLVGSAATTATGQSLFVYQPGCYYGYGIGCSSWSTFTTTLNNEFDQVTIGSSFDDIGSFDALMVSIGQPTHALSAGQQSAVSDFVNTGKRTLMIGENSSWQSWNASILDVVGGTYLTSPSHVSGSYDPVFTHALTSGVSMLSAAAAGVAEGGTSLFSDNFSTLWGGKQNTLTVLDVNLWSDGYFGPGNEQFVMNTAAWLSESTGSPVAVPEPMSLLLLGTGLLGVAGVTRRRRQALEVA